MRPNIPDINADADKGIQWNTEDVHKGGFVVCDYAQIPAIVDVDKFRAEFGDAFILNAMDGSSLRVQAQAVCRRMAKDKPEEQRAAIINLIRGTRNVRRGGTTVKIVRTFVLPLPDGEFEAWQGDTQAEMMAALVDAGWPAERAAKIADRLYNAQK